MLKKRTIKPVAAALGTTFVVALAAFPVANAADNPFSLTGISSGYMVADSAEGKCGEGKCGGDKTKDTKEAEGKCGGEKSHEEKEGGLAIQEIVVTAQKR